MVEDPSIELTALCIEKQAYHHSITNVRAAAQAARPKAAQDASCGHLLLRLPLLQPDHPHMVGRGNKLRHTDAPTFIPSDPMFQQQPPLYLCEPRDPSIIGEWQHIPAVVMCSGTCLSVYR